MRLETGDLEPQAFVRMSERGAVFVVSAPSGSGKSTLVTRLIQKIPNLTFSVSFTTRKPRGVEIHGREYFFVDESEFERMIAQDQFIEYAQVFGHYYGTAKAYLEQALEKGKDNVTATVESGEIGFDIRNGGIQRMSANRRIRQRNGFPNRVRFCHRGDRSRAHGLERGIARDRRVGTLGRE